MYNLNYLLLQAGLDKNAAFIISIVLCAVVSYLVGSLNFGIILSNKLYHGDVRTSGSGNAGSTNMLRTYGKKAGALTFLCDILKTVAVIMLAPFFFYHQDMRFLSMFVAGFACMIGHSYPGFFKFLGGKGVACFGALVVVTSIRMNMWYLFVILLVLFLAIVLVTKYVSLGSVICALAYPVLLNRLNGADKSVELIAVAIGLFVVFQHRKNIVRLLRGEENKTVLIKGRKKSGGTDGADNKDEK